MSDVYWYWCPEGLPDGMEVPLTHYGFRGTAVIRRHREYFFTLRFEGADIPAMYRKDVVYRIGQKLHSEYETSVPERVRKMIFPVEAEDMDDAVDTILRGMNRINKCFFDVIKMNEYYDDIVYITDRCIEILDYFIGILQDNRDRMDGKVDSRIRELRFKRSYMMDLKVHMIK